MRPAVRALIWLLLPLGLIVAKWSALHDPHYWDSLGCYVAQARFIATHGLNLGSYRELNFIRPPLFTGLLAGLMSLGGTSRFALHLFTLLFGALLLPATYAMTRRLGGDRCTAWKATALCALSPIFFAQVGLVQSDLPAATLAGIAWALLLGGQTAGAVFTLSLAVLTKESAYFLCLPAMLLQVLRTRRWTAALPFGIPGLVLLGWELLHLRIMGYIFPPVYGEALALRFMKDAFLHDLLEGGRFALLPLLGLAVFTAPPSHRLEVRMTAVAFLLLPVLFPAPLPRYMLPSLSLLCALSALGLGRLSGGRRTLAIALVFLIQLASYHAPGWDSQGGHHVEQNLVYRRVLAAQRAAATALGQAGAKAVLARFPMYTVLTAPPEDGYLPAPLSATVAVPGIPLSELCAHDYLVDATQGDSMADALSSLRKAGALRLWRRFGRPGEEVVIYAISCIR